MNACIAWTENDRKKTKKLSRETALKFQRQLEQLFEDFSEEDNYKQLGM